MRGAFATLMVGLTLLAGCDPPAQSPTGEPPTPPLDASGQVACEHARRVAKDVEAGILIDAEIRAKIQEIHGNARLSSDGEIRGLAERMLAEFTRGDGTAAGTTMSAFLAVCSQHGAL